MVKLRRDKPKVSYLCYPNFDSDAHPALRDTFVADLKELRTYHTDYSTRDNPPVLHRKECFVAGDYPQREKFAALTLQEIRAGVLDDPESIGTRKGWEARLSAAGLQVIGHDVVSASTQTS